MPDIAPRSVDVGDYTIQFGVTPKTEVEGRIPFAGSFGETPTVVLSPFWEGQKGEVGHAETIDSVGPEGFVVMSDNAAPNYAVSWIAVGRRDGAPSLPLVKAVETGDMILTFSELPKPDPGSAGSGFGFDFAAPPNVQVSPVFAGQRSGVGHAEAVQDVQNSSFTATSGNHGADYSISWIATGTRPGVEPLNEFAVGDMLIRTGTTNKVQGLWRASLGVGLEFPPPPAPPPVVVVSPLWAGGAVGHAETLNTVERHYFEVASGNAAHNYSVSFIAIGPRA